MATNSVETNQRNITDFFPTISNSSKQRKSVKSSSINQEKSNNVQEIISLKKPTPKRRAAAASNVTTKSVPASKKLKSSTTKNVSTKTETKMVRRGRCPIDYGPAAAIRKLDFKDCIESNSSDQNNNDNSSSESFGDFLKSKGLQSITKCESSSKDEKPLMKADDIKQRLQSCNNLSKLKEQLVNINNCSEKIRKFKEMKIKYQQNLNNASSSNAKSSPIKSSPRKTFGSPMKPIIATTSSSQMIKPRNLFQSPLKTPTKNSASVDETDLELPLPIAFKRLVDMFKIIDYNSWRMFKRQEVCTFDKMKQCIEHSTHRTFTLDSMLKILTVLKPNPKFRLTWELYAGQLNLVLTPIYRDDNLKCLNSIGTLLEREKEFYRLLLELTRVEHLKFLSQMKLNLTADDHIYRWHPMFALDSVSDIKPDYTLLPMKPKIGKNSSATTTNKKSTTILDYFGPKTDSVAKIDDNNNDNNSDTNGNKDGDTPLHTNKIQSGLLKGISADLLNKVRAKEAAKLARLMRRPPEIDREIRTLSNLIDISRIIYDCFVGSPWQRSIEKDDLIERISTSVPMSALESRRHLEYLSRFELDAVGSKWIKIIQLQNSKQYVQIDCRYSIPELCSAFRRQMQKLQPN
ncbi:chromatin licensing and DNA replication factor double parked [Dermatophagoides pteronyssinus]|uniref:chromatin licensing and DNA replication factor double parked n=1 Tax=Dermatophagoides pteronyssinus TaxID=6956 RepID=UPI003F66B058